MKTIENNRLLAEFLGAALYNDPVFPGYDMHGIIDSIADGADEQHYFEAHEMPFDTDWNWIMAVVEKIEDIEMVDHSGTPIRSLDFDVENRCRLQCLRRIC